MGAALGSCSRGAGASQALCLQRQTGASLQPQPAASLASGTGEALRPHWLPAQRQAEGGWSVGTLRCVPNHSHSSHSLASPSAFGSVPALAPTPPSRAAKLAVKTTAWRTFHRGKRLRSLSVNTEAQMLLESKGKQEMGRDVNYKLLSSLEKVLKYLFKHLTFPVAFGEALVPAAATV